MHILFVNPQGNFDKLDSYWTMHPDFGGQLVYVKEIATAMANLGHKIAINPGSDLDQGGNENNYAKDFNFHSTYWIAKFFGLTN